LQNAIISIKAFALPNGPCVLLGFNVLAEFTYVGRSARFLSWPIPSFACIKTARACFMDEWEMKRVSANAAISWRRKWLQSIVAANLAFSAQSPTATQSLCTYWRACHF